MSRFSRETGEELVGPPPCAGCIGVCCSVDAGFKFVQLTPEEWDMPVFRKVRTVHREALARGFWFKPKNEGSGGGYCPFFDMQNRQCGIYEDRPQNCRNFDCRACQPNGSFLTKNPQVLALLLQHKKNQTSPV